MSGARGDVPVDVPDIIEVLVFAQVREVDPRAQEQAAIVALEQAIEASDHLELEALEDALRRGELWGPTRCRRLAADQALARMSL